MVIYRDYQNFQNDKSTADLGNEILKRDLNNMEFQHFLNLFTEILSKPVPMMRNDLRANVTKDLRKAKLNRSRLRSKFLRHKTEILQKEYKKQQNFCSNLLRKAKKDHFAKIFYRRKFLVKCDTFFLKQRKIS